MINEEVNGPAYANDLLELHPKARIIGDVHCDLMEVQLDTLIAGELRLLKSADQPALRLAASNIP